MLNVMSCIYGASVCDAVEERQEKRGDDHNNAYQSSRQCVEEIKACVHKGNTSDAHHFIFDETRSRKPEPEGQK